MVILIMDDARCERWVTVHHVRRFVQWRIAHCMIPDDEEFLSANAPRVFHVALSNALNLLIRAHVVVNIEAFIVQTEYRIDCCRIRSQIELVDFLVAHQENFPGMAAAVMTTVVRSIEFLPVDELVEALNCYGIITKFAKLAQNERVHVHALDHRTVIPRVHYARKWESRICPILIMASPILTMADPILGLAHPIPVSPDRWAVQAPSHKHGRVLLVPILTVALLRLAYLINLMASNTFDYATMIGMVWIIFWCHDHAQCAPVFRSRVHEVPVGSWLNIDQVSAAERRYGRLFKIFTVIVEIGQ